MHPRRPPSLRATTPARGAGRRVTASLLTACAWVRVLAGEAAMPDPGTLEILAKDVAARETAFAQTLADRRFDRFADFVGVDAVFRGATLPLVGREAVARKWKAYYDGPKAAFSWAPDLVTVSADGRSALSTGPVRDSEGHVVSRFMTLWRLEADGQWRVQVDQGVDLVCAQPPSH